MANGAKKLFVLIGVRLVKFRIIGHSLIVNGRMHGSLMLIQSIPPSESFRARWALKMFLFLVNFLMEVSRVFVLKSFVTNRTRK